MTNYDRWEAHWETLYTKTHTYDSIFTHDPPAWVTANRPAGTQYSRSARYPRSHSHDTPPRSRNDYYQRPSDRQPRGNDLDRSTSSSIDTNTRITQRDAPPPDHIPRRRMNPDDNIRATKPIVKWLDSRRFRPNMVNLKLRNKPPGDPGPSHAPRTLAIARDTYVSLFNWTSVAPNTSPTEFNVNNPSSATMPLVVSNTSISTIRHGSTYHEKPTSLFTTGYAIPRTSTQLGNQHPHFTQKMSPPRS